MDRVRFATIGLLAFSVAMTSPLVAAVVPAAAPATRTALRPEALAAVIDRLIARRWAERNVQPAPPADDAEFVRRVYLDVVGCIPSIIDARDFLDDTRPDKRRIWVEDLLEGRRPAGKPDAYARHLANVWRAWLLSRSGAEARTDASTVERFLQQRFAKDVGYDRMVYELISQSPGNGQSIFDQINEGKPENLAGSTARLFLGIKLECAQCHDDRSGGNWTRTQFWELAAFFAAGSPANAKAPTIVIPGKDTAVAARFLVGRQPSWPAKLGSRAVLGEWVTSPDNPYFARAGVNRVWGYFFGTGLVEPIDELGEHNLPSHPELLDELARQFAAQRFDLKYLVRAITSSRVYQLSSAAPSPGAQATPRDKRAAAADSRLFAQKAVCGLTPEQMFDSLAEATEYSDPGAIRAGTGPRARFMERFANQDRPAETQTSLLQALYLMNSKFMAERTSMEHNPTLVTIANAARTDTRRQVKTLYLVALSREPRPTELARLVKYVDSAGAGSERQKALADVYWALLNSAEFRVNH